MNKPYEKYKDSGKEWIAEIPEKWATTKLKWISNIYAGGTPSTNIDEYWQNGNIPWLNSGSVNQKRINIASNYITDDAVKNSSTKWVPSGSIVMALAGQGKTKGIVAVLEIDATCNQSMAAIVPELKEVNNLFLYYWLDCNYERIRGLAGTELRDGLNLEIVGDINSPLPTLTEQTQIALYLDYKTNIIDQLISKKQKLIELLKEKRQAIINEAVTRGLNPNATMKDSGIEWLGEVPEEWDIMKLTWLTDFITCGVAATPEYVDEEIGVPFLSAQNVKPDRIVLNKYKFISKELHAQLTKLRKPQKGDLLVTRVGAGIGEAAIVDVDFEFSVYVSLTHIRTNGKCLNKYLMYFFSTDYAMKLASDGTVEGGGQGNLNVKNVENYRIGLPSFDEQIEIVNFISTQSSNINLLISQNEIALEKLKEYRQSIISEAVTGKIDVREWQAPK